MSTPKIGASFRLKSCIALWSLVGSLTAEVAWLAPASKSGIREGVGSSEFGATAAPGAMPGAAKGRTVEVLAAIQALDRKAGTATLCGPRCTVTLAVPGGVSIPFPQRDIHLHVAPWQLLQGALPHRLELLTAPQPTKLRPISISGLAALRTSTASSDGRDSGEKRA